MVFQLGAELDPARRPQPDESSGASGSDGYNQTPVAPGGRASLSPEWALATLGALSLLSWMLALTVPVMLAGARESLPFFAAAVAALLCSVIDQRRWAADAQGDWSRFEPIVAVCLAFVAGGLLTYALNGSYAGEPLAWWRGAVLAASVIAVAQVVQLAGRTAARRSRQFARRVAVIGPVSQTRARIIDEISGGPASLVVATVEPADFRLIAARAAAGELDEVVLLRDSGPVLRAALDALTIYPIDVSLMDEVPVGPSSAGARTFKLQVQHQRQRGPQAVVKRLIDIIGAAVSLVVLAPLLVFIAVAIRLESPGPALFKQRRFGHNGRTFTMWKFRSMRSEASDPTGSKLTSRNDDRVTRIGAMIRKNSFDELPQLINILIGDLSFVGPRPHPSGATANGVLYDVLIPNFRSRYRVKPGLTGLAQCSGLRGNTDTEKKLLDRFEADMRYVETWSLGLDVLIVLRTVGHLIRGENAY